MGASYLAFYEKFVSKAKDIFESDEFYQDFMMILRSSQNNFSAYRRLVEKKIDIKWLTEIEKAIPSIDQAIRNPGRYIKQEEEILPIELSRNITPDSIKYLAQHTNLIKKVENGMVIPSHILNIIKEESYETYENRFVNTLLNRLYIFINKRYDKIFESLDDESIASVKMESEIDGFDGENITYKLEVSSTFGEDFIGTNDGKQSVFLRIDRIRRIINEYATTSSFAKAMQGTAYVRPPIMRTNAILKNTDYKKCLELWLFIESYDKVGYEIEISEGQENLNSQYIENLYSVAAFNYAIFRNNIFGKSENEEIERPNKRKAIKPKFIKQIVEDIVDTYDVNEVEFKKVFQVELSKALKTVTHGEAKIVAAIDTALKNEKMRIEFENNVIEKQRLEKAEQEKKKKEKLLKKKQEEKEKLLKKKLKEKEHKKLARENQIALERARREKKKASEKAKREKEKLLFAQKAARQKAKEKEQLAKQKQALKENKSKTVSRSKSNSSKPASTNENKANEEQK